jgi:hypothetical protein
MQLPVQHRPRIEKIFHHHKKSKLVKSIIIMNVSPHEDDDLSSMPLVRHASHEELQKAAGGPGTESLIKGQDNSELQLSKSDDLKRNLMPRRSH